MTRCYRQGELQRRGRAKREAALARPELRDPTVERVSAAGPVSMGVKALDPNHDRMVAEFLASRGGKE